MVVGASGPSASAIRRSSGLSPMDTASVVTGFETKQRKVSILETLDDENRPAGPRRKSIIQATASSAKHQQKFVRGAGAAGPSPFLATLAALDEIEAEVREEDSDYESDSDSDSDSDDS